MRAGLTTLEVLLALSITGGVVSVATYTYVDYARDGQVMDARAEVQQIHGFVETHRAMFGELPKGLTDIEGRLSGLDLSEVLDPWGHPYAYAQYSNGRFTLYSRGPDGLAHTADDIHPPGFEPGLRE